MKSDDKSDSNAGSGPIAMTQEQYDALNDYITSTTETPPPYALPFGAQCTNWALHGLAEAGVIPDVLGPEMGGSNFLSAMVQTMQFNPLWQYFGFNLNDFFEKYFPFTTRSLGWLAGQFYPDSPAPEGANDTLPNTIAPNYSPLVLDLDGDGVETLSENVGIQFDLDNNGFAETIGWVAADDGLLALDKDGNGTIGNGNELFGNNSTLTNGNTANDGFAALADYDDNSDGVLDANDDIYADLKIWRDLNSNGISESNELQSLEEAGVSAMNLGYTYEVVEDEQGNEHRQHGSYIDNDGNTHDMTDVWFSVDPTRTTPVTTVEVPDEIKALPYAQGAVWVRSLYESMALDESWMLQAAA